MKKSNPIFCSVARNIIIQLESSITYNSIRIERNWNELASQFYLGRKIFQWQIRRSMLNDFKTRLIVSFKILIYTSYKYNFQCLLIFILYSENSSHFSTHIWVVWAFTMYAEFQTARAFIYINSTNYNKMFAGTFWSSNKLFSL